MILGRNELPGALESSKFTVSSDNLHCCGQNPVVDTVDGRNPALIDMVNIPLFTGYYTNPRWLFGISSINSMVNISPMS